MIQSKTPIKFEDFKVGMCYKDVKVTNPKNGVGIWFVAKVNKVIYNDKICAEVVWCDGDIFVDQTLFISDILKDSARKTGKCSFVITEEEYESIKTAVTV